MLCVMGNAVKVELVAAEDKHVRLVLSEIIEDRVDGGFMDLWVVKIVDSYSVANF
jgi:hypothetical protein